MIPREFDFDGSQRKIDIKQVNDLLYKSRFFGWNHSISDGKNLPAFLPDRSIPIKSIVKADPINTYGKESPIVIPKGRIVAVNSILKYTTYASNGGNTENGITPSGVVRLGTDVFGNPINANVNDEAYGYGTTMNGGFVTLANGGTGTTDAYTQLDVDWGIIDQNGNPVTNISSQNYTRAANVPIGLAVNTMFIENSNGSQLNYTTQVLKFNSIETDTYVTFPYFNSSSTAITGTWANAYDAIKNDFTILYGDVSNFISGKILKSDVNGMFVLQNANTTVDETITSQTVGKLVLLDNRFPKEKMDEVITYGQVTGDPTYDGTGVTGSDTNGIPVQLYLLGWKVLVSQGVSAPTTGDIMKLIDDGDLGYAKINIHVS